MRINFTLAPLEITGQMQQLVYLYRQGKTEKEETETELKNYILWFKKMTKKMFKDKKITRKARIPSLEELLKTYL